MQEKINYDKIMALGFTEQEINDDVYFRQNGYGYSIITKQLTKTISLDWEKETKLCFLTRVDSPKTCNIQAELPIMNLSHLKDIINFFTKKDNEPFDYSSLA
jgi:predicted proteasome-type protease